MPNGLNLYVKSLTGSGPIAEVLFVSSHCAIINSPKEENLDCESHDCMHHSDNNNEKACKLIIRLFSRQD